MYSKERELNVIYNVTGEREKLSDSTTLFNPITKEALTLNDVYNLYNDNLESTYVINDNDIEGMIDGIEIIKEHFKKKYLEAMSTRVEMYEVTSFNAEIENQVSLYDAALSLVLKLENLK